MQGDFFFTALSVGGKPPPRLDAVVMAPSGEEQRNSPILVQQRIRLANTTATYRKDHSKSVPPLVRYFELFLSRHDYRRLFMYF